mmetsp:Transcript_6537/g.5828  ORF Transcript_6537/g.5828 Transcript_6537/m.5828 type:complete len:86 (-) Transcript_6537:277-534(-)
MTESTLLNLESKAMFLFSRSSSYLSVAEAIKNDAQDADSLASFDRREMRAGGSRTSTVSARSLVTEASFEEAPQEGVALGGSKPK